MKSLQAPKLFVGASLLFWGVCADHLFIAVAAALVLEGSWIVKKKWDLDIEDYVKISDLSSLLLLGFLVMVYLETTPRRIIVELVVWLPVAHLPLIFAQMYSRSDKIVIGTKLGFSKKIHAHKPFNFSWPYAFLTIFAAAVANNRSEYFFPVLAALVFWGLFSMRSPRYSTLLLFFVFAMAFIFGYKGHHLMERTHLYLRKQMYEYYAQWLQKYMSDPFKAQTAIGDIGNLKFSSRILMRVSVNKELGYSFKLIDSTYNTFVSNTWYKRNTEFKHVWLDKRNAWKVFDIEPKHKTSIDINAYLPKNKGAIAVPNGTYYLSGLNVAGLMVDEHATLKVEEGPDLIEYKVDLDLGKNFSQPPISRDLSVPEVEKKGLDKVLSQIDVTEKTSKKEVVKKIVDYFSDFSYSLKIRNYGKHGTHLANFLHQHKKGHCEFFATATTLLLRQAGIPARYRTGFSVREYSSLENKYIVRERNAHSWVTAFINGSWVEIDTTPSIWFDMDEKEASVFEPIYSFLSFIRFQYEIFRKSKKETTNQFLAMGIIVLTLFLLLKIYYRRKRKTVVPDTTKKRDLLQFAQGLESPLYEIETVIEQTYKLKRREYETIRQWVRRIDNVFQNQDSSWKEIGDAEFINLLQLHERMRFDPHGISEDDKTVLTEGVKEWIERYSQ